MLFLSADHTNVVDCGPMRLNSVQPLSLHIASEFWPTESHVLTEQLE